MEKFKKILKRTLRILGIILLVLLITLIGAVIFLDSIVKGAIENFGPQIAGVRFEVGHFSLKLLRGRVEIRDFYMYNPEGFNTEYALKLGDIAMETDILSWIGNDKKGIIREVRLRDVEVNYEAPFPQLQNSNLQAILDHVTKAAEKQEQELAEAESAKEEQPAEKPEVSVPEKQQEVADTQPQEEQAPAEPKRFELDKLIIDNVRLTVTVKNRPEIRVPLIITLPEMGPVGTDEKGLTGLELSAALATEIVRSLTGSVVKATDEISRNIAAQTTKIAGDVSDLTKEYSGNVKDAVKTFKEGNVDGALQKGAEAIDNVLKDDRAKEVGKDLKNLWDGIRKK